MEEQLIVKDNKRRKLQEDLDLKDNECRSLQSQSQKHASVFKNEIQAVEKERNDLRRARELHEETMAEKHASLQEKIDDLTLFSQQTVESQDQDHQKALKRLKDVIMEYQQKEAEHTKTAANKERDWSSTRDKLKHQIRVAADSQQYLKERLNVQAKEATELKAKNDSFDRLVNLVTEQRDAQGKTIDNLNAELDEAQRRLAIANSALKRRNEKIQEWKDFYEGRKQGMQG